jgi:glycosyltransferase involved in cell wall biosynthesis
MLQPLVSIIIPTYNRAHLIDKTLDSVIAQTFVNWECIIVDDGSTDNTEGVIKAYVKKDSRFQFHNRPADRPKGANACRNFGFEQSKGDFIQWFDSDDLMVKNKLECKINAINNSATDFVISKTANFSEKGFQKPYEYNSLSEGVTVERFILRKIHWYTYDVLLRREIAEKISFHEMMKSWQDYYYFILMLLETTNYHFINEVLTLRRLHGDSIQNKMTVSKNVFYLQLLDAKYLTYNDIKSKVSIILQQEMLYDMMNISFYIVKERQFSNFLLSVGGEVKKNKGLIKSIWFYIALLSGFLIRKGEKFLQLAKGKSHDARVQ